MSENSRRGGVAGGVTSSDRAKKALTVLTVGLVSGVGVVIGEIALATLVFSGDLAPYLSQGIGLVLFGIFAGCVVIALGSGFLGAVSAPAVPTMLMLGVIGGSLTATGDELFPTMVAIVVLCSMATAVCALLIARFRLANLVRFIPYPVSSGFVAGTGGVACWLALSLMGVRAEADALAKLFDPLVAANWGIGIAYGFGLYFATQRWTNFMLMPVSLLLSSRPSPCWASPMAKPKRRGSCFRGCRIRISGPRFHRTMRPESTGAPSPCRFPNILTLVLVTLLCVVMYVGGLEVASNRELDWNREFGAIGFAGALAGLGGGPPSCPVVPTSLRSLMFGVDLRATGIVAALVMGSPLLFGDALLKLVPMPLMGGVLLFTGIALLDMWLLKVRKRVPRTDYAIILAVFATILAFGFFEGGGAWHGHYSHRLRVPNGPRWGTRIHIYGARSAQQQGSPCAGPGHPARGGAQGQGLPAAGLPVLRRRLPAGRQAEGIARRRPPAAVHSAGLHRGDRPGLFDGQCHVPFHPGGTGAGTEVVLGGAPDTLAGELRRNLPPPVYGKLVFAADADSALQHCEDKLLADWQPDGNARVSRSSLLEAVGDEMQRNLDRGALFEDLIEDLGDWLEPRDYGPGESLLAAGEASDVLQFIVDGRISILDAAGVRIREIGPGMPVNPHAAFDATASAITAVAESPCRTATLDSLALRLLEESDRALALRLYRFLLSAPGAGREPRAAW